MNSPVKIFLSFFLSFGLACTFSIAASSDLALQFDKANQAYSKGNYKEAINVYSGILEKGVESPELYFNIGNSYFKSDSLPQAILYYEKAKKLAPRDEDIAANLKIANLRTVDKIEASEELFITQWAKEFILSKSSIKWAVQTIVSFFIAFSLLCFYMLAQSPGRKKLFFFSSLLFFGVTAFSFVLAQKSYELQTESGNAILFASSAQVRSAPNEVSTNLFQIHSGIKFTVIEQNGEYSRVKLTNGNEGWLKTALFRTI